MRSEQAPNSGPGLPGLKGTRNLRHDRISPDTIGLRVDAAEGGPRTERRSSAVAFGSDEGEWEVESLKEEAAAMEKEMKMVKRRGMYEFTIVASSLLLFGKSTLSLHFWRRHWRSWNRNNETNNLSRENA